MKAFSPIHYHLALVEFCLVLDQGVSLLPFARVPWIVSRRSRRSPGRRSDDSALLVQANKKPSSNDDGQVVDVISSSSENEDDDEWIPDHVKARTRREEARIWSEKLPSAAADGNNEPSHTADRVSKNQNPPSPYTDEEEEIIAAMGGKTMHKSRKREWGFLGDSTLTEITSDYSVPICYIADVLCMWGVPVPINVNDRLGDLVTGEQAFALLEAVNSLDVASLHDRYSNTNLMQFCYEFDISLQEAFEMAMKEGWSLPFGVQTCLRVEQEDELLRVLGRPISADYSMEEAIDID